MAIGVFFYPEEMTSAQYDQIQQKLAEAGQTSPKGRQHHFAFGDNDSIIVVDVWESQEDFVAFGEVLMPIIEEMGIEVEPGMLELHNSM
jgi:hypothetical protein